MEAAFERGDVSDWVEFFRQGALTPLCHDRFPKLTEELRETLLNGDEAAANLLSVLDKVYTLIVSNKLAVFLRPTRRDREAWLVHIRGGQASLLCINTSSLTRSLKLYIISLNDAGKPGK